jgi:hypothetical protein
MIESIPYVLTGIGIIISILYYTSVLRNANKTRELALNAQQQAVETRQAQLFMQIYQEMSSQEHYIRSNELLHMEWEDWDDYVRKYGSDNNPEAYALRCSMWYRLNGVGLLVKAGLIDVERVFDLMSETILWQWEKWGDIIIMIREKYNNPGYMAGFEFIAEEMVKESESRGYPADVPEGYGSYIPKE